MACVAPGRLMEGPGEVAKAMKSDCGTRRDWQRCWSSSRRLRPQRARGPRGLPSRARNLCALCGCCGYCGSDMLNFSEVVSEVI